MARPYRSTSRSYSAYGYIWNTHVRVDLLRENLAFKKKAWIEFIGLTFFFIPYLVVVLFYFAFVTTPTTPT